ncbi:GAF domain-containing protein [Allocoleopsis sp.]|uniref:GAF domain-containing protein n=1 Tax=Allocoleopsis sp. TaxID=3088169 RepID=UPI0039C89098
MNHPASEARQASGRDVPTRIEERDLQEQQPSFLSTLASTQGTFSAFLAPLTRNTFKQVITEIEKKLEIFNQTLSMLDSLMDAQGVDDLLEEILRSITLKTGELLRADRTTIFVVDEERNQLWSIVPKDKGGDSLEIRIPIGQGIAGEVAATKQVINIPYDFFDDPRSYAAKEQYERTGYRVYTMLAIPVLNEQGNVIAIVQLLNKLKFPHDPNAPLEEKIDPKSFTTEDESILEELSSSIRLIMESSRSLRQARQKQQAAQALIAAVNNSSLDLEETFKRLMEEAKQSTNADRSFVWLIDSDRNDLWTKVPINGVLQEIRIPISVNSFLGRVALRGETLNIWFDLYDYSEAGASNAKQTDQRTGYRTCSLLCMPVFNADSELIGVMQLVNKKKQGEFPPYDPANWPQAPECWQASFDSTDQEFMKAFNIQAGVALQNAMLFSKVKQSDQRKNDILENLSAGILSTDKEGRIIALNARTKELLGLNNQEKIEGILITEILQFKEKESNFSKWIKAALKATNQEDHQQYYPEQTLILPDGDERSVNLSITAKINPDNTNQLSGLLIVIDEISDIQRLKSVGYRYMSQDLVEQLLQSEEPKLGGDRREISVLFLDIRSFTTLTENMEPEGVVSFLNEYFEVMVEPVIKYKGTLDKYIGDAMMVTFGAALPLPDHPWMAVQSAIEMCDRLRNLNSHRIRYGKPEIKIGIGINSDTVIAGYMGSSRYGQFTAIGDGVNFASRLEGITKLYGCDIIISEHTFSPCANLIQYRELDYIYLKGKSQPIKIYEVVGLRSDPISQQQQEVIELYHKGREYYLKRQFRRAWSEFATIIEEIDPQDKAAQLYMERSQYCLQNPPSGDWDGVWKLTEK